MTITLVVISLFLLLAFKKPAWALAGLLALLPTYLIRLTIFGWPTTLLELLIVAFLLGFLCQKPKLHPLRKLGKINWGIALFILVAVIATIISPEKTKALGELKAFFIEPILLFYAAIILFAEKSNVKLALQSLFVSSSLISLAGVIQYYTYTGLPIQFWGTGVEPERIVSVFDYPNALALFLAPLFGLFAVLIYKKYQLFAHKWIEVTGLTLMAGALFFTFSRGAWLAVLITLGLFLFREHKRVGLIILGIMLAGVLGISPIRNRIVSSFSDASSVAHIELMKVGIQKTQQSPILGNGLYGFRTTLEQAHFPGEILNYPHNILLNFWLETGILGLLAFFWIMALAMERQKNNPATLAIAGVVFLMIMLLHGLVDVPYFKNDLSILFWMVIALFYIKPTAIDPT